MVPSDHPVAEQVGQSKNQIFRYIRLTELIPELMDMVDGKICLQDRFLKLPKMQPVKIKLHRILGRERGLPGHCVPPQQREVFR